MLWPFVLTVLTLQITGVFGVAGSPAFNVKSPDLAVLYACMSQLCQKLKCHHNFTGIEEEHFSCQNLYRQAVLVRVWRM